ncbi:MAG TPA: glycosyltransferase family 39 protein [Terriglobia bacterium]|nr:glycosyltransferase family 39 protein [Terriglobia bacterium]
MKEPSTIDLSSEVTTSEIAPVRETDAINIPEKSWSEWAIALLLFVGTCLYLRVFYNYTQMVRDEGFILQDAQRVLGGEVLYRDFFSFLTPGSYYWLAMLFKIFGDSILVARAVLVMYGGTFSVLLYMLARRVCSRTSAVLAVCMLMLTCLPSRFIVLHNWDSTFWTYLAIYSAVWLIQKPHWTLAGLTGFLGALTCLFEQSKGGGLVLGLAVGLLILSFARRGRLRWSLGRIVAMLAGFLGPFLVVFINFWTKHSVGVMLADWLWPLKNYSAVNKVPYGFLVFLNAGENVFTASGWGVRLITALIISPFFWIPVLPFLFVCTLIFWTANGERRMCSEGRRPYYILTSAIIVGLIFSTVYTWRADFTHIAYLSPPMFLMVAWILDGRDIPSPLLRRLKPALGLFLFVSCLGFGLMLLLGPLNSRHTLQTRRGDLKAAKADEVLDYVQAHVRPGEKMYIYPSFPIINYLTGTFNPTRHLELIPGVSTPRQFQEAANELSADRTNQVLFEPSFRERMPPILPAASPEIIASPDPVAEYIATHYRACASLTSQSFSNLIFMVRKDLNCPNDRTIQGPDQH